MEKDIEIFREQLDLAKIEKVMLEQEEQVDIPLEHTFSAGIYIRQIFIPKGTIIMGKRHRKSACNVLLCGELSLYMGEGQPTSKIKGPMLFTSAPFTKKLAYCHEDAIFMNILPTEETDLDKIEEEFIISEADYLAEIEGGEACLSLP